jgi:hypothetical protein
LADFYNITSWSEKPYFQTGGTRDKVIVENPSTGELYYFKTSLKKEKIDYRYEYWSEIIASEVGSSLGFNLLKYDVAFNRGSIGCISKSMVTEGKNKLTEGMGYLTGYDTTYNPEDKSSKKKYTFQFIQECLNYFRLEKCIPEIIKIIIFDSIIGNGDRHQENWGIITDYNDVVIAVEDLAKKADKNFGSKLLFSILAITTKAKRKDVEKVLQSIHLYMPGEFSQIYDSGSCLGREIADDKVALMLKDSMMLEAYVKRGQSEIHWKGDKLNHFELIRTIKNDHHDIVLNCINEVKKRYQKESIIEIVHNIDVNLPEELNDYKLPYKRKEFIVELITLRIQKLFEL